MNLYQGLLLQRALTQAKEQRLSGSLAVRIVKLNKEIEDEKAALREVMQSRWDEDYKVSFDNADKETKDKMNEEFVKEALSIEFEPKNMISLQDVDQIPLTLEEAQLLIEVIGE